MAFFRTIILFDQVLGKTIVVVNVGEGQRDELFREGWLERKRDGTGWERTRTRRVVLYMEGGKGTLIMVRKSNGNICVM